ncbi:MAG: 50S ribosomal protein L25 [Deltaproteobacteria bacterium]|nr:50S ribosomal protein L25 [Deltaproteobacteria bacterium]
MLQYDLSAQIRNEFGKGSARSLRRSGGTPAVLYGPKTEPIPLVFTTKTLTNTLLAMQRRNAVFSLDIADGSSAAKRHVIVKEIQTKPVDDSLLHVDFFEVSMTEPIVFDVPIKYAGNAKGVELGGEMNIFHAKVSLKGIILDIPDFIEIDVSNLGIGDRLHFSDLVIPDKVEILSAGEETCVAVQEQSKAALLEEQEMEAEGEEAPAAAEGAKEAV